MRELYPEIEPLETGMLDVGDGQHIYWEVSGKREGKPVVFLHGGPGGGTTPAHRRLFDPAKYRIVLFDQRGCGFSIPHASEPDADLSANTTWHLVADMERLRAHLGIDRWQVFGGSWGSALALAYAETHPERVTELVLRGIFTLRRQELDWFYEGGASAIFPDLWEEFLAPVPVGERAHLIEAYHRLLSDPDPAVHQEAAIAWSRWESSTITLRPQAETIARFTAPEYATAFARIENHYFRHGGWWDEGQLIRDAQRLRGIPAVIIQGRYDVCTPMMTAWDLHRVWPEAELRIVDDAGHAFDEPGILDALIGATDRFAVLGEQPDAVDRDDTGVGVAAVPVPVPVDDADGGADAEEEAPEGDEALKPGGDESGESRADATAEDDLHVDGSDEDDSDDDDDEDDDDEDDDDDDDEDEDDEDEDDEDDEESDDDEDDEDDEESDDAGDGDQSEGARDGDDRVDDDDDEASRDAESGSVAREPGERKAGVREEGAE
jgi:proline iminopeptidase